MSVDVSAAEPHPLEPEVPSAQIHRLTTSQYDEMARLGILTPDDHVELLEGWLVEKMTKNPPHRIATRRTRVCLDALVPAGWYVDSQEPIVTGDSEPEPDIAIVRGRTEDYTERNPGAEHIALVIEVADVTLLRDRRVKSRIYGRAGIPTYWILNLVERRLEVYTAPTGAAQAEAGYGEQAQFGADDHAPVIVEGVEVGRVKIADLLP